MHPQNKNKSGGYSLFNNGNGRIYPDFLSLSDKSVIADAKYKPLGNIKGADYLQIIAYMYRFNAKLGFYLFPNNGTEDNSSKFELLEGKNQKRTDKILIKKLGLWIPQNCSSFTDFSSQIKESETKFLEKITNLAD